jgi:BON domain-containing protein
VAPRTVTAAAAFAAVALAVAVGCSTRPSDAGLVEQIQAQMFSDPALKHSHLRVSVSHGEVTLAGAATSDAARLEAYKIATQTAGVKKVTDQMSVPTAEAAVPSPATAAAAAAEREPPRKSPPAKAAAPAASARPAPPSDASSSQLPMPSNAPVNQAPPLIPPPAPAVPDGQPAPGVAPAPAIAEPQPSEAAIPTGTTITVEMIDGIDSAVNRSGEVFHASLDRPLMVDNNEVVPRGADVYVQLTDVSSAGRLKGKNELHLQLIKMDFEGRSYTLVSGTYAASGSSRNKDSGKKIGGGAVVGAILGAIAGGGKGAAIGATIGGGGGAIYQGATRGKSLKVTPETRLDFQLESPLTVTVMPKASP